MILIFSYLHRNQRLVLHLNLLARVLSNREIPFQALISHHKTSNKENYKIEKVKVTTLDSCYFCKNVQILRFLPG